MTTRYLSKSKVMPNCTNNSKDCIQYNPKWAVFWPTFLKTVTAINQAQVLVFAGASQERLSPLE